MEPPMTMNGNGAAHLMPPSLEGRGSAPASPYAPPEPKDIIDMTDTHERDNEPLRTRMRNDYSRYRLDPHVIVDKVSGELLETYAVYTSNEPRVFADKLISWQNLAELLIRVPHMDPAQHTEEADNLKERFAIGCLRAADERLKRLKQPSLRASNSFFATVRGGYVGGRALLVNRADRTCYPDITAWDPMHIHWGAGQDGLDWASYKIKKTRQQIRDEYGVEVGPAGKKTFSFPFFRPKDTTTDAEKQGVWLYDFYDGQVNTVVTDGVAVLKEATPHMSPRVPVYLELVGSMPLLQSEAASNLSADVGESAYVGARSVYDAYNDSMSIMLEIVNRARRQTVIYESRDGKKLPKEDVFKEGTSVATATGDRIYTLELQKVAQETGAFLNLISGEVQRATLPHSSYGETEFQLSGYAITQLRQAMETVLAPGIAAHESIYLQISNLLHDQFMSGSFEGIKLSGVDSNRQYFNQKMTPELMQGACDYTSKMVSRLPQDDTAKWAQAQIAKELELLSDEDIHDNVLGTQDAKQAMDKVKAQKADRGLPEAQLYNLGEAAAERGNMTEAQMYLLAFDRLMMQQYGLMPPQGGTQAQTKSKGKGMQPEVMPNAATGAPPQPETSNNGPALVAPGTPRPGARGQSA
jgi:hypothetical protein